MQERMLEKQCRHGPSDFEAPISSRQLPLVSARHMHTQSPQRHNCNTSDASTWRIAKYRSAKTGGTQHIPTPHQGRRCRHRASLHSSPSWGYVACSSLPSSPSWGYEACPSLPSSPSNGYVACASLRSSPSKGYLVRASLPSSPSWGYEARALMPSSSCFSASPHAVLQPRSSQTLAHEELKVKAATTPAKMTRAKMVATNKVHQRRRGRAQTI